MRHRAHMYGPSATIAISVTSSLCKMRSRRVAGVIEPALAEAEQQRVLRKPPERLDAWEAYQRGLWHFCKYGAEDNKSAQTFFRQAIALDPNFAPGHYGYSLALFWDFWLYSKRSVADAPGPAQEEARLAVSLDDKDAMAHA